MNHLHRLANKMHPPTNSENKPQVLHHFSARIRSQTQVIQQWALRQWAVLSLALGDVAEEVDRCHDTKHHLPVACWPISIIWRDKQGCCFTRDILKVTYFASWNKINVFIYIMYICKRTTKRWMCRRFDFIFISIIFLSPLYYLSSKKTYNNLQKIKVCYTGCDHEPPGQSCLFEGFGTASPSGLSGAPEGTSAARWDHGINSRVFVLTWVSPDWLTCL